MLPGPLRNARRQTTCSVTAATEHYDTPARTQPGLGTLSVPFGLIRLNESNNDVSPGRYLLHDLTIGH